MSSHLDITFNPDPDRVRRLLSVCPAYAATPLAWLNDVTDMPLMIKDETERMGLGAFKGLGGAYAVPKLIEDRWIEQGGAELSPEDFVSDKFRAVAKTMTFVTASAGNHGIAVAAGARVFGAKARIHLSSEVPEAFEQHLEDKGAEVVRSGDTYAASVDAANKDAEDNDAILLADGSWPGYIDRPSLILEGYTVLAEEMRENFEDEGHAFGGEWPSHVFLQAGVGGLASSVAHMIRRNWAVQPEIYIVEPEAAPCLKASHEAGEPTNVTGPSSNMGRLDCKEPSLVAFAALEAADVKYITVTDENAAYAADELSKQSVLTTPSGAAGLAALRKVLANGSGASVTRPLIVVSEGRL